MWKDAVVTMQAIAIKLAGMRNASGMSEARQGTAMIDVVDKVPLHGFLQCSPESVMAIFLIQLRYEGGVKVRQVAR